MINENAPLVHTPAVAECLSNVRVSVADKARVRGPHRFERLHDGSLFPALDYDDGTTGSVSLDNLVEVVTLAQALTHRHAGDAHIIPYAPPGWRWFYRLRKRALASLVDCDVTPLFTAAFIDADNVPHEPVPLKQQLRQLEEVPEQVADAGLPRPGVYITSRGMRLFWPLLEGWPLTPATVDELEARLAGLRRRLRLAGVAGVDEVCRDWTRLYRAPFAVRDGVDLRLPSDFKHVEVLDLEAIEPVAKAPRPSGSSTFEVPADVGNAFKTNLRGFARIELRRLGPAVSGEGGDRKTFIAALIILRSGLRGRDALELLEEYNASCLPRWSQQELEHKLKSALEIVEAEATAERESDA